MLWTVPYDVHFQRYHYNPKIEFIENCPILLFTMQKGIMTTKFLETELGDNIPQYPTGRRHAISQSWPEVKQITDGAFLHALAQARLEMPGETSLDRAWANSTAIRNQAVRGGFVHPGYDILAHFFAAATDFELEQIRLIDKGRIETINAALRILRKRS